MFGKVMAFPVRQDLRDWVTQYWNILLGRRVDSKADAWLTGPIGAIGENAAGFVERVARERGLRIERGGAGAGLMESLEDWGAAVRPAIAQFYQRTADYRFSVRTSWRRVFGHLGYLVAHLFSRRVQQLNVPRDGAVEFDTEIIKLVRKDGQPEFTIWHRSLRETGEVVFSGIYTSCRIPSGEFCVKAIFPLPQGSATVLFRPEVDAHGNLRLVGSGSRDGDPGFYFLVEDGRGCLWKHPLPALRQSLRVSERDDGSLEAEHVLGLWSLNVFRMIYRITEKRGPHGGEREVASADHPN